MEVWRKLFKPYPVAVMTKTAPGNEETNTTVMQKRSPRFRRQPEGLPRRLVTARSLAIIHYIATYRFLPTSLIMHLVGGDPRTTAEHLYHLYHRGTINRFQIGKNTEFVYFLDSREALNLLISAGYAIGADVNESVSNNREKNYAGAIRAQDPGQLFFVQHELMITRFHAGLELACTHSAGKVQLVSFKQGSVLYNRVKVPKLSRDGQQELFGEGATEFLPHRPDAAFILRVGDKVSSFLYEADRKTTSTVRFREKLRSHFHFVVKQRLHEQVYGVPRVRAVLVETLDSRWAETLRDAARHRVVSGPKPSPLFWFVPSGVFTKPIEVASGTGTRQVPLFLLKPEAMFRPMWATPVNNELQSLLD